MEDGFGSGQDGKGRSNVMKLHETSTQRFVKEYANWKISILEDLAKSFPEKATMLKVNIVIIRENVKGWERSLITTDEVMRKIAEF